MILTMKQARGIGIAAPQIGKSLQIFVIDEAAFWETKPSSAPPANQPPSLSANNEQRRPLGEQPHPNFRFLKGEKEVNNSLAFINPELTYLSPDTSRSEEGCLSLMEPVEIRAVVKRSKKVIVKATDFQGRRFKLQGKRLLAKALQHEMDHLKGKLITEVAVEIRPINPNMKQMNTNH